MGIFRAGFFGWLGYSDAGEKKRCGVHFLHAATFARYVLGARAFLKKPYKTKKISILYHFLCAEWTKF